uniref:Uncharacterized protein n=1 Tax=Amphimedon queenslandica TaxID=400682 RepID=A0A1X7VFC2_AMPQE
IHGSSSCGGNSKMGGLVMILRKGGNCIGLYEHNKALLISSKKQGIEELSEDDEYEVGTRTEAGNRFGSSLEDLRDFLPCSVYNLCYPIVLTSKLYIHFQ